MCDKERVQAVPGTLLPPAVKTLICCPNRSVRTAHLLVAYTPRKWISWSVPQIISSVHFVVPNGVMTLIEANPQRYRVKSMFRIPSQLGKSWPHPVIVGGCLYVRDEDVFFRNDVRNSS